MLTSQNVEAELSYAYLHTVASKAGFSCEYRNRHLDGAGVDATITEDGRKLAEDSILPSFAVDVQVKATYQHLAGQNGRLSYALTPRALAGSASRGSTASSRSTATRTPRSAS